MAQFDVCSAGGLKSFNQHMEERSYVGGYVPTSDDFSVLEKFKEAPSAKSHPYASRWYIHVSSFSSEEKESCTSAAAPAAAEEEEEEDDFDCFGDDTEEDIKRQEEIQAIADAKAKEKAAKGKVVIEKSVVVIDVKPWDSETDLKELEAKIRTIEMEGLEWKGAEQKPIAFGVCKLVIMCHIVDKLISVDDLQEKIQEFEDEVQSTDIAAFSKL